MEKDYFQLALLQFNKSIPQWYGWKTHKDNGDKIPNNERMQYKYIKLNSDTATLPSEADVNAKIQELKEQFDLLYHDMVADKGNKTGEWFKHIKAVKDANPKE